MTPSEAATILAVASTLDARLRPVNENDADTKAKAWAITLDTDLPVDVARKLVLNHYKEATTSIMPANLNRAWRDHKRTLNEKQRETERRLEHQKQQALAVPMPETIREQLKKALR